MADENRFKRLELRPGVRPAQDDNAGEKSLKERVRDLDRRVTLDSTIDHALKQEEENSLTLHKRLKEAVIAVTIVCVVLFLAAHRIFGFDGLVGLIFKAFLFVVFPIVFFRWLITTPE